MLRNVSAPVRDFTRIANALVWDDSLSDTAFRLLVRAIAMPVDQAGGTTVTQLAAGLGCGRITADRARKQLQRAGLLHATKWRSDTGQVRSESLVSDVPLSEAEAGQLFAEQFEGRGRRRVPPPPEEPGAGGQSSGSAVPRSPGTALPSGERPGSKTPPSHPAPAAPPEPRPGDGDAVGFGVATDVHGAEAERVLVALRQDDARLVLGPRELRDLVPLAAEWLLRGAAPEHIRAALVTGLPRYLRSPRAVLRHRLVDKMPDFPRFPPAPRQPAPVRPLVDCPDCDRPFRPAADEIRCGSCRRQHAADPVRAAQWLHLGGLRQLPVAP